MSETRRVSWIQSNNSIDIDVIHSGFTPYINGKRGAFQNYIQQPLTSKDKALYASRNAYGNIGKVIIYNERAQELLALQESLQPVKVKVEIDPLIEELQGLEEALYRASDAVRRHDDNPGIAYGKLHEAENAFNSWVATHQDVYDAEMARRRAEKQKHDSEVADTLIGRMED